ncbi:MAG: cytochrome c [Alphaproteobacteria bacterium]|nr:cytochrome c [Alphaproteobacteria bacterium]
MRLSLLHVAAAAGIAVALAACTTLIEEKPPANPQAVVNQRVAIMKTLGAALGTATNQTQGKTTAAAARKSVVDARTALARAPQLFPRGTALGDRGVTQSRALSIIFANRSDFEGKFSVLADRLAQLDAALAKGAKAETTKAITDTRAACSACHNKYRAPED